jgi:hypothetical protein
MERTCYESELAIIQAITETWKYLTSSGWVVSGHLSEVCVVLYCRNSRVSNCYPMTPLSPSSSSSSKSISSQETSVRRTLRTEELSRDVQGLASHNYDLLAIEQLLRNSDGQPTKEVTLAIDRDLIKTKASAIRPIIPIHPKLGQ